jgi:hypothetical protein
MDIKLQRLETIPATDEAGKAYTVHAFERLAHVPVLLDSRTQWEPTGQVEYRLASGERLDVDTDGDWLLPGSELRLHRQSGLPPLSAQGT